MTHPQQNTERHERILKLLADGITPSDVARLEGISRQRVYQIIAVHKVQRQTRWIEAGSARCASASSRTPERPG